MESGMIASYTGRGENTLKVQEVTQVSCGSDCGSDNWCIDRVFRHVQDARTLQQLLSRCFI